MEVSPDVGEVITIGHVSPAERRRLTEILTGAGYSVKVAGSEWDLRLAAGDESTSLIVVEGGDQDWELARLLMSIYLTYGEDMPPVLAITVRDPAGPAWLPAVSGPTVAYLMYGYADRELLIFVEKILAAFSRSQPGDRQPDALVEGDRTQAEQSGLILVFMDSVDEEHALVSRLTERGLHAQSRPREPRRLISFSKPRRITSSIRENAPTLIIADLKLDGECSQQMILDSYDGSLPHELGVLLIAPPRVIPNFLKPMTRRFVGFLHKDVGIENIVRYVKKILSLRTEAMHYLASATQIELTGGEPAKCEYLKGRHYETLGDADAAIVHYTKSLEADERSAETHRRLAKLLGDARRPAEATHHWARARDLEG